MQDSNQDFTSGRGGWFTLAWVKSSFSKTLQMA